MSVSRFYNEDRLSTNLALYQYMIPSEKWMQVGFRKAIEAAKLSKDPNRTVGASVMDSEKRFSDGFNGFPKHIIDAPELLNDRDRKRSLMVHAECNACDAAPQTRNCILFVTAPCCHVCALQIVNRGIIAVHALINEPGDFVAYEESFRIAKETFALGGVLYREYDPDRIFKR
jgi:deoxycytidylate deaminase